MGLRSLPGVTRGSNFGNAWRVRVGRPGLLPGNTRQTRVSRGPYQCQEEVTPKVVRKPRKGYSGVPVAYVTRWRHGKGTRVAARLPEGDTRVMPGSATVTPGAHHPGNTGVKPGYSLVTEH